MPLDYSGQNLRGRNFKGQNLTGANFIGADIRGANFTNAILTGASFSHARSGLQRNWVIFLLGISLLLSTLSEFFWTFLGSYTQAALISKTQPTFYIFIGVITLITLAVFYIVTVCKGLLSGTVVGVIAGAGSGILVGAISIVMAPSLEGVSPFAVVVGGSISGGVAIAASAIASGSGSTAIAAAMAVSGAGTGMRIATIAAVVALSVTVAIRAGIGSVVMNVVGIGLSIYISYCALTGNEKYTFIRTISIAFAAIGGTTFQEADLTDADFTSATLKSTDFRNATLTRTCFHKTKELDCARPGKTYLQNVQVRQLVVTGKGENQNYDRLDLRGINLYEANLENASFIDTDFYQANLQKANFSRSILVRTNFERSDIRGACLTGSCIQDWIISAGTKLDGIVCDYVYLKWIDEDKRDQMPPRGKFKEGGFVTFVKYILDTVELYHEKDINPRLALTVLQKMAREYDEPFDIVALGKRGEKVFIQVKVSENVIRENFKEDYYSRYDTDLKLWSGNIHQLPPAVNSFIENRISEIVSQRTDDFIFVDANYVEGNYTEISQGEVNMSGDRTIHMGDGNYNERIQGNYVQGNYYAAGQQSLADAAAEIQKLLEQLDKSYSTDTTAGKMAIATQAIQYIDSNQILAQRVLGALKAGGTQALAELLNHPAASFVIGALDDWLKSKGS